MWKHIPDDAIHTLRRTSAIHSVKKGTKPDVVRKAFRHAFVDLAWGVMDEELQQHAV